MDQVRILPRVLNLPVILPAGNLPVNYQYLVFSVFCKYKD